MKPKIDQNGFTLIELLVAVTILAVGLLALAGLQVSSIKGNEHANTISQATALAEEQIEQIRNMKYTEIVYNPNPKVEAKVHDSIYTRSTLVEDDTPMDDLKRITVTVNWVSRSIARKVELRTIVANEG
ncbi:MAG: type IV pilus modification protein PilV [Desulfuromonadaceae bacterium]|nr:type IV pilus modification protein PilV [Desulfuromonadaceae bacterium]